MIETAFNEDWCLRSIIDSFANLLSCFFETGIYEGATSTYIANKYQNIDIYTCETNLQFFNNVSSKIKEYTKISIFNIPSPQFFYNLFEKNKNIFNKLNMYYLDAHWEDYWPLQDEVKFITNNTKEAIILIHDTFVPHCPELHFDQYKNNICGYDYIKDSLNTGLHYNIYYPNYDKSILENRKLVGYMFIVYGNNDIIKILDNNKLLIKKEL